MCKPRNSLLSVGSRPVSRMSLGLSLSYDIIVKQHSGSIEVDTLPGQFTEFKVILPRNAVLGKAGAKS